VLADPPQGTAAQSSRNRCAGPVIASVAVASDRGRRIGWTSRRLRWCVPVHGERAAADHQADHGG
jgi:hypothetical protein